MIYVTRARGLYDDDEDYDDRTCWTLSEDPDNTGWETDSGASSYGLSKETARYYAKCINEHEKLKQAMERVLEICLHSNEDIALEIEHIIGGVLELSDYERIESKVEAEIATLREAIRKETAEETANFNRMLESTDVDEYGRPIE